MKEETGLEIFNPTLVGVKQFPIKQGRYVVLLFKSHEFKGNLKSSSEGEVSWIKYSDLPNLDTVEDFEDLLKVMNSESLNEFQYVVHDDIWQVVLK